MKNWYILNIKVNCEEEIIYYLRKRLDLECFFPFILKREKVFIRSGVKKIERCTCFPGYIFIESEVESDEFLVATQKIFSSMRNIYNILSYGNKQEIALREEERRIFTILSNSEYCIKESNGIIKGLNIFIQSGALLGMEPLIKNINRHKREATIEVNLMGELKMIVVPLNISEKY